MNYREEIKTVLNRDDKQYGKVWRVPMNGVIGGILTAATSEVIPLQSRLAPRAIRRG